MLDDLSIAAAPALWAVLAWQAAVCQTSAGVPCFTLTYEQSVWALVKSPVRDMVTAEAAGTMAVRQDGSFVHRIQPASRFAVRGSRNADPPSTRLHLAGSGQFIVRGPSGVADSRLPPLFFLDRVYRRSAAGESNCRSALEGAGKGLEQTGKSTMLGEPVVNWQFKTAYGEVSAALAPGLDCQVLRMEAVEYRYGYLPVRKELFEAKTLRHGEPAAALFALPKESK